MIPNTFAEWKYCIEKECKVELSTIFIEQRIQSLTDHLDAHTIALKNLYGELHVAQLITWFQQIKETK
jgi:hypothetical protein